MIMKGIERPLALFLICLCSNAYVTLGYRITILSLFNPVDCLAHHVQCLVSAA